MSRKLATIKLDCVLDFNLDDTDLSDMFNDKSYNIMKRLEFKSMLKRFDAKPDAQEA